MPSASKTIVQLLVASVALAVKVPAHSPSRGQMLLQVSANAQLRSFVEPTFHSGRDTGLEKASLVEMLRHAKDAAHHALEAGGSADRNATQAAWAQDIIDAITDDIVPGIFADHKLDQARLNDSASKINNCLTSLQDTNETTLAPGIAGASSNKADMQIQTKVLEDLNETSLMLCNATHTRLASHTCILPALPLPDEMASYMDCVQKWLLASQILHTRCDDAHSNFSAQEKFATGLLQNYTLRSCSTASDIINTCGVYTACRVEHDSDFTQVVAAAKTSVSGRMTEMQALKKIACFLGVAKMSPAELATDSGASKFSSCEREEDADAEDLLLVFPSISTAIVCPLPTVAATGCVRRPGCVFGAPVFITSESQQHLRENPDGSIGLGSTTDAAAQWTLSDAGHGTVLISSYSGKHLQDLEGTVTLDRNLQAGEQWTLQATGTGDFLVTSHNGQHLQDFEGILLGDEVRSAAKWTIVLEDDGTPACLALPDAETALPGQTQAPTPEMARGQSTPSPDTSVVTSTMSTTAVPTTAVPTTAAPTLEADVLAHVGMADNKPDGFYWIKTSDSQSKRLQVAHHGGKAWAMVVRKKGTDSRFFSIGGFNDNGADAADTSLAFKLSDAELHYMTSAHADNWGMILVPNYEGGHLAGNLLRSSENDRSYPVDGSIQSNGGDMAKSGMDSIDYPATWDLTLETNTHCGGTQVWANWLSSESYKFRFNSAGGCSYFNEGLNGVAKLSDYSGDIFGFVGGGSEVTTFDGYGGGWTFVNEAGRSKTDVNDVATISLGGYFLPVYQIVAPFKEVLVQRISDNWCDSWGGQSGYWVASSGASMGVQADLDFWYTYNNHGGDHTWLRQSTSYLPPGSCDACWVHPGNGNEYDTHGVTIESLELDGSVVLITFPVFKDMLKVGNLDSFYGQAGGCDAEGPVSYRVYTRTQAN